MESKRVTLLLNRIEKGPYRKDRFKYVTAHHTGGVSPQKPYELRANNETYFSAGVGPVPTDHE